MPFDYFIISENNGKPIIITKSWINKNGVKNLFVKFAGVSSDQTKMKIGVKESSTMIDFVTLKAYIFPYINLVWVGLIIMAIGLVMSMIQRAGLSKSTGAIVMAFAAIALFYMFLLAN